MNKFEREILARAAENLAAVSQNLLALASGAAGVESTPAPAAAPSTPAPAARVTSGGNVVYTQATDNKTGKCFGCGKVGMAQNRYCKACIKGVTKKAVAEAAAAQAPTVAAAAAPAQPAKARGRKGANCSSCGTFLTKALVEAGRKVCDHCADAPVAAPAEAQAVFTIYGKAVEKAKFDAWVAQFGTENTAVLV